MTRPHRRIPEHTSSGQRNFPLHDTNFPQKFRTSSTTSKPTKQDTFSYFTDEKKTSSRSAEKCGHNQTGPSNRRTLVWLPSSATPGLEEPTS